MKKGLKLNVPGAGHLLISHNCSIRCGGVEGFSFDVSWSKFGLSGGVISKQEAVALANHILEAVKQSETNLQNELNKTLRPTT